MDDTARLALSRQTAPAASPAVAGPTRALLEGPIARTLLRLACPNVAVGLVEAYFVASLGTDAIAGVALVFPVLMLMQMMSAGAIGGGVSGAVARALGAGRRDDADALLVQSVIVALGCGAVFMIVALAF